MRTACLLTGRGREVSFLAPPFHGTPSQNGRPLRMAPLSAKDGTPLLKMDTTPPPPPVNRMIDRQV